MTIDNSHKFAEIVGFELSDDFELFSHFLFGEVKVELSQNSSHWGVEVVFNCIIGPSWQKRCDLGPFIADLRLDWK